MLYYYAECCYADCRNAECCGTTYQHLVLFHCVLYIRSEVLNYYAECHYADCHNTECHGAKNI